MTAARPVPGQFSLVLHTHLPWLPHHGRWPVGEEWLYQSWAASYLPVMSVLRALAAEGHRDLVTLGVTPVVAAQLDDPHSLLGMHHWLGNWALRAREAANFPLIGDGPTPATTPTAIRALGRREGHLAAAALTEFETAWRHGGSAVLRPLADSGAIEILGGPLAHPFAPLLDPRLRRFCLEEGLRDTRHRIGRRPRGIWAPECAFAPGMESEYDDAGIGHFLVDGPAMSGDTALARPVGGSSVLAFGRDLSVSYRVWSPKSGYPGHAAYRDFHTYDHVTGLKPARVTGRHVDSAHKAPYDPEIADHAVRTHADDFVATVRERLISESARIGRPAHVTAAFDTELFGHWWFEGPAWLDAVLRALPAAGITVGTLSQAADAGYVGEPLELGPSSWGSGKDWRVWAGDQVSDLVELNAAVVRETLDCLDKHRVTERSRVLDQLVREAILTVSSDWPFMVSKDTAAEYARERAHRHAHHARELIGAIESGRLTVAEHIADRLATSDSLFGALDARGVPGRA